MCNNVKQRGKVLNTSGKGGGKKAWKAKKPTEIYQESESHPASCQCK